MAKAGTAMESGIAKRGQPSNMPTAEKSGTAMARSLPAAEFAAIREKELAEIGDAFKTGLTSEMTVSRPRPLKNSPAKPKT